MSLEDTQARGARTEDGWIGSRPTAAQIAAFLAIGSVALIMAGVQPVVLGGLVDAGRLDVNQLGWSVTIEFLAIGLGVGLADAFLPPRRLKLVGFVAALVLAVVNLAGLEVSGLGVLVIRALAGLAEGGFEFGKFGENCPVVRGKLCRFPQAFVGPVFQKNAEVVVGGSGRGRRQGSMPRIGEEPVAPAVVEVPMISRSIPSAQLA